MIEILIPPATAFFRQRIPLSGVDYQIDMSWNERAGAWFLSLFADDDTPLVQGLKVVSNFPLLARFRFVEGIPPGELAAVDVTDAIDSAGYDELGTSVRLVYIEPGDT